MKRWISILCGVVLLFSMLTMMAAARTETVEFGLSVTEGKKGDTVTLSLDMTADSYFSNATMYVHYDAAVVKYVEDSVMGGEATPTMNTMYMGRDHADKEYVKIVYATINGISKGGTLLTLEFEVLSNDPAVFSLSFDECCGADENGGDFDVNYVTFGCVLNNRSSSNEEIAPPVITPTTPSGESETGITRAPTQKEEQTTATTKPPQSSNNDAPVNSDDQPTDDDNINGNAGNDNGNNTDSDKDNDSNVGNNAEATPNTDPSKDNDTQGETSTPTTVDDKEENRVTTKPQGDTVDYEDDAFDVGAVIAIVVAVVLLGGGIAAFAVYAARKAKQDQ